MKEQVRVFVEKDGTLSMKVEGLRGSRCVSITQAFEGELGEVIERQKTADFYKSGEVVVRNRINLQDTIA